MSGTHPDPGPELRALAQSILDRLEPAIRLAAARAASAGDGPGRCQQVWCPVCALAAMVTGEQHPLLSVVAEHSVALLSVVRAIVDQPVDRPAAGGVPAGDAPPPAPPPDDDPDGPPPPGRYQHIPVTVQE
ncbi:hypothetical protein FK535_23385 [Mycolicibacterium sp. 018/SC-01/001]|uniref:hypothetical protein n=1 Tax=Mycolicibacterium sp. 018/SC-01/001 TaxID=2592069 RepID=UPI00118006A6|nr:hypothetical protein [Mycolicibacterium sp. 018/SC-01/001]TRW79167.1 hypothetical protein FK535_23385 [Mycolicibacterium sp. 018/SC-01/001]